MDDHTKPINTNGKKSTVKYVLNVLNQSSRSSSWILNEGNYTIGRLAEHEIILDDVTVSRNHGKIIIESDNLKITDNNSTNGIYINDVLIKESTEINSGDKIQIGKFLLLFTKV